MLCPIQYGYGLTQLQRPSHAPGYAQDQPLYGPVRCRLGIPLHH